MTEPTSTSAATSTAATARAEPGAPYTDPTLGIPVETSWRGEPVNRLVTIGDSLTQGFQSCAVFHTGLSYPAIIAHELGWADRFRQPDYDGCGGLPLNLEFLLRDLEEHYGKNLDWWETAPALFRARRFMDRVEDYWERGPGAAPASTTAINHNLAVFSWDLRDALEKSADVCRRAIGAPKDDLVRQMTGNAVERAALRALPTRPPRAGALTQLGAAAVLGEQTGGPEEDREGDPEHGIETLIVFLGANNALSSVIGLKVAWSGEGYDDLSKKGKFTVWRPEHFAAELDQVADAVERIRARHVIWCAVPHVTIAPIARGVASKMESGSRYFPHYTRPWISDSDFDVRRDPHLTGEQARSVDEAIDEYNDALAEVVRRGRHAGRDWYLLDSAGLLDRLASRRFAEDEQARPGWWTPYPLPEELRALDPVPNSRFLLSDGTRRIDGGLFSLDGVHPTTVAYGVLAQELITVMRSAGVEFRTPHSGEPRPDPVQVDFARLVRRDTLINHPPGNLRSGLHAIGWADEALDVLKRTVSFGFTG
ncbi:MULTISPECIES: hypothetical protein [unclassified Streptomyces]|uniref:hypothetical protein n=1 Tax=unclassified Streptomyces TaxID=2593676 RepID=UPI002DD92143|nr:hypothetical protein [Streptomyces sp. NBC_01795]WSA90936.1 hypothetical protein OIE63_04810 [Streptomyces sp. NBC_01795]WSS45275.1 hypothetical protein OG220_35235 [Streptomyces sp. NBC_01187]